MLFSRICHFPIHQKVAKRIRAFFGTVNSKNRFYESRRTITENPEDSA